MEAWERFIQVRGIGLLGHVPLGFAECYALEPSCRPRAKTNGPSALPGGSGSAEPGPPSRNIPSRVSKTFPKDKRAGSSTHPVPRRPCRLRSRPEVGADRREVRVGPVSRFPLLQPPLKRGYFLGEASQIATVLFLTK